MIIRIFYGRIPLVIFNRRKHTFMRLKEKFIGDRAFYSGVLAVAVPIMVQNGITTFVGLLDNIMVGRVGTEQMSGVAIANLLLFVFNLCVFGGVAGAGIFGAQYFGNGDHEGVRNTFRFKLIICACLTVIGTLILVFFDENLIRLYLHESESSGDLEATLQYGREYIKIMLFGLVPFTITQAYSGTLRETKETMLPMKAGIAAVLVNLFFNYVLIFGHFGVPALGVKGAAIATVISRYVEMAIVAIWTHTHKERNPFIVGVYKHFRVPGELCVKILKKGMPLMLNETLWSLGVTMLSQCYSLRGLSVVAAVNISNTISNVFSITFLALGNAVGIIVGNLLGANKPKEAKSTAVKMIFFSVTTCTAIGILLFACSSLFPKMYNTDADVKQLAELFIMITACMFPAQAFSNASYFILRSGGQVFITMLFDSVFTWVVVVPVAYCVSRFTALGIVPIFIICSATEYLKALIGYILVRKDVWIKTVI